MTLRTLILATSALVLSAGLTATGAEAATQRHVRQVAARGHTAMHKPAMRHRTGRGMGTAMRSRGRDAESSSVDQLNAQSLEAARGGAPAAAAPAPAAPQ